MPGGGPIFEELPDDSDSTPDAYCSDVDLLPWEPNIARDAAFVAQTLISGTGNASGTTFTTGDGSFIDSHVATGHVLVIGELSGGAFPVVNVESDTELTFSVLYDELDLGAEEPAPSPPTVSGALAFAIRTFAAQRSIVTDLINRAAGIGEGTSLPHAALLNPRALKRVCALGTIQMIYSALAAAAEEPENYAVRADLYERLYRKYLRALIVDIDTDGDGSPEISRKLAVVDLIRS